MTAVAETVKAAELPGVTAVAATFRSLSVNYDSLLTTGAELEQAVAALVKTRAAASHNKRIKRCRVSSRGVISSNSSAKWR